jgi:spore germination cell wall hydrolase CwlJ-like protein
MTRSWIGVVVAVCLAALPAWAQDKDQPAATKDAAASQAAVAEGGEASPDPAKAKVAVEKAAKLEEKAAPSGDQKTPPPPAPITKVEVQAVDPAGKEPLDDAITCLARTIYWEAKGEDTAGMEAIASVVMNRVGKEGYPDTVCGVVKQGKETGACQFSWWCDGKPDDVEEEKPYAEAKEVARKALNKQLKDRTDGALYFYSGTKTPDWASKYVKTTKVGDHYFYKPKDGDAK